MDQETARRFTVGELASMAGVSVRTLQYYDKTGLLKSSFSEGGRRTYGREDLMTLQQILFLKSLGFPLDKIKSSLLRGESGGALAKVFAQQRDILLHQIESLTKIVETLDSAIAETSGGGGVTLERLISILSLMREGNPYTFILRYFSEDQMRALSGRFASHEEYDSFMRSSDALFARLSELYRAGADPAGPEGQQLAAGWWQMAAEFSKGDKNMLKALVSSGKDIDNWPDEARAIQEPVRNFLTAAFETYFKEKCISDILGAKENE